MHSLVLPVTSPLLSRMASECPWQPARVWDLHNILLKLPGALPASVMSGLGPLGDCSTLTFTVKVSAKAKKVMTVLSAWSGAIIL